MSFGAYLQSLNLLITSNGVQSNTVLFGRYSEKLVHVSTSTPCCSSWHPNFSLSSWSDCDVGIFFSS